MNGTARPTRPGPTVTSVSKLFWDGLRQEQLLLQRCRTCRNLQHHPRALCKVCWADDLEWVRSSGVGTVWTFTMVHKPGHPFWEDAVPYPVGIVQLDEGPRVLAGFKAQTGEIHIGMRVRATYEHLAEMSLLSFESDPG